ncbi:MAG: cereblon family protein [Thiotrichales bacterium]|nr:cereblon family protein [Thiotrichales bacterium]
MYFNLHDPAAAKQRKPKAAKTGADREPVLRCRICEQMIATQNDRIPVNSSHDHTCINPAGIEYHIGCFDQAPGCSVVGSASLEHTWFAGHYWQISVCRNCHEHMGWYFKNGQSFFGLILERLKTG